MQATMFFAASWQLIENTMLDSSRTKIDRLVSMSVRVCQRFRRASALLFLWFLPACVSWAENVQQTSAQDIKPRVASINLCADQLVVLLAEQDQILSLSNLSHQQAGSYFFEKARKYPINEGHSEQILTLAPDLVIVGQYSSVHTVNLLREVGLRIETLPIANDLDGLYQNILSVADWLGQGERGRQIVDSLKLRLSRLLAPDQSRPMAAAFDPNGYTSGRSSLRGQMLDLAGWDNAASVAGIDRYGKLSLEAMIHLAPDALIESPYSPGTYSRAQVMSRHPALLGAGLEPHIISIPSRMTVCAGPWTMDVIEQLQAERLKLMEYK